MDRQVTEHRPPERVEVLKVIKIRAIRGNGSEGSPIRNVDVYYSLDGEFLFEIDNQVNF